MVETVNKPTRQKLIGGLVIGLLMALITYNLGQWQTRRAEEKQTVLDQVSEALKASPVSPQLADIDPLELEYRKIELQGRFLPETTVYVDNRQIAGRPAVQVIQGFEPEGADFLIPVDRGLLPRDPREPRRAPDLPDQSTGSDSTTSDSTSPESTSPESTSPAPREAKSGFVTLTGTLLSHFPRSAELRGLGFAEQGEILKDEQNGHRVWSNFASAEFAELTGRTVSRYVVTVQPVQGGESADLPVEKRNGFYLSAVKTPEMVAKHRGYAFQWFSMTVALVLLTAFFVYREWRVGHELENSREQSKS